MNIKQNSNLMQMKKIYRKNYNTLIKSIKIFQMV